MGSTTSVLECSRKYPSKPEVNCTIGSVQHGHFNSNPSISGIGTDISFVITAGLSLLTCGLVQLLCDRFRWLKLRPYLEPLVLSFSDQQLVRGLAMSIATLYTSTSCSIDAYRYNILCYLVLMSIVSHLSATLVLRTYVNGQPVIAGIRFLLVFVQVFFAGIIFSSRVSANFPTGIPSSSAAQNVTIVLPAVCFQLADSKPYSGLENIPNAHHKDIAGFWPYIVLCIFFSITIIFTLAHIFSHLRKKGSIWEVRQYDQRAAKGTIFWYLGLIRGFILLGAWIIWVWSVVKLYQLRAWMDGSGWMSAQGLGEDNEWTFGQLLSVFLLGAAPLSLLNAWSDVRERKDADESRERSEVGGSVGGGGSTRSSAYWPGTATSSRSEFHRLIPK